MRPVLRGDCPKDDSGVDIKFKNYQQARGPLIECLGEFCSYCEMHLDAFLAVEHVLPKKPPGSDANDPKRELDWNNFLLACTNCNSTKGNREINLSDYFWPDQDNTFLVFTYSEGGLVSPSDDLCEDLKPKAKATIELVGLDKNPLYDPEAKDRRWLNRKEAWDIAKGSKKDLQKCNTEEMRTQILRTAVAQGFWSIWMTVFNDDPDMLRRFIIEFPGTAIDCFDKINCYSPVARQGGQA